MTVETQPERTALAWQRTGLGILGVGGLLGHRALEHGSMVDAVLAVLVFTLGLAVLGGLAPARYRRVQRKAGAPGMVAAATGAVVLVALAAGFAVLAPLAR